MVGAVISFLVTGLFIHFGASMVVKGKQHYWQGLIVAFAGTVAATVVLIGAGFGTLAVFLALAAWALVAAIVYRTSWLRGAVVGLAAWVLWLIVN